MRLPKLVRQLGWISFFGDVASEMAYPLLPLFMASLGAGGLALGAVEGAAEATANILKGWGGLKSDRAGKRKPFMLFGYALSALGKPLIALATAWPLVAAARIFDRIGKGVRTAPRDALLAEAAPPENLAAAYGYHRGMDTAGAFVGVLVAAAAMYWFPGQYRWVFVAAVVPGVLSVFWATSVREPIREAQTAAGQRASLKGLPRSYWLALAPVCLFSLANSSDAFMLTAMGRGHLGLSDLAVVGLYAVYNLAAALLSYPMGILADRKGRLLIVGAGWAVYAVVYAWLGSSPAMLPVGAFCLYGLFQAAAQGATKAIAAQNSPKESLAGAVGVFFMISGICTLFGNLLAGYVADAFGYAAMFRMDAALALLACGALVLAGRPQRRAAA